MPLARRSINPNFSVKLFATKREMHRFLKQLGFVLERKRYRYNAWATIKQPHLRAISYELKEGGHIAKQIGRLGNAKVKRPRRLRFDCLLK
jgi:hypothetical protein